MGDNMGDNPARRIDDEGWDSGLREHPANADARSADTSFTSPRSPKAVVPDAAWRAGRPADIGTKWQVSIAASHDPQFEVPFG
jgi:hypothetical protein